MVEVGATTNSVAVDGFNRTYVLSTVQRTGLTNNNSADLWTWSEPASVIDRKLFYNNSAFDGRNTAQTGLDDNAVATDKTALIPGARRGDVRELHELRQGHQRRDDRRGGLGVDVAEHVRLRLLRRQRERLVDLGRPPAPVAIGVRPGAGTGGADRVTITWADGAIAKKWLRVQVKPTTATGLATPDNFIFGNAIGESGDNALSAFVDAADVAARGTTRAASSTRAGQLPLGLQP